MPAHDGGWTATDSLDSFDCTLANLRELVLDCLDAAGASSVAEIGAEHGLFTSELLEWGVRARGRRIVAIDPAPRRRLRELAEAHPELELVVQTSHAALPGLEPTEAVIVDGDHNHYTVSEELRLIEQGADGGELPLILVHDIGWPLARRDSYHDPERIPEGGRRPIARQAYLVPGEPETADRGLYYECVAATEGGRGNGVLTAVEDFIAERPRLRLAVAAPFFGLGVVWDPGARWAKPLEAAISPWVDNPLLERLEEKRIEHLVAEFENLQAIDALRTADYVHRYRLIGRLLPLLGSRAFALAERISTVRQGGRPNVSRADLRALLEELAAGDIDIDHLSEHPEPAPERYSLVPQEQEFAEAPTQGPRSAVPGDLAGEHS